MRRLAAVALIVATACSGGPAKLGPLSIDVPPGWRVTSSGGDNLQIANGTTGDSGGNTPGNARAVFDVYTSSTVTAKEYASGLEKENVAVKSEDIEVAGYDAVRLTYIGPAVGGRQEAVFIPRWDVRIVYRAAFPNDDAAFNSGHAAFRDAIDSLSFSGKPLDRA